MSFEKPRKPLKNNIKHFAVKKAFTVEGCVQTEGTKGRFSPSASVLLSLPTQTSRVSGVQAVVEDMVKLHSETLEGFPLSNIVPFLSP